MEDENDEVFFRETSDAADTVRPLFLINGKETEQRVGMIAKWIDKEIEESRGLPVHVKGAEYRVYCLFYPSWDGKYAECKIFQLFVYNFDPQYHSCFRLIGANNIYCTQGRDCNNANGNNLDKIREGTVVQIVTSLHSMEKREIHSHIKFFS